MGFLGNFVKFIATYRNYFNHSCCNMFRNKNPNYNSYKFISTSQLDVFKIAVKGRKRL